MARIAHFRRILKDDFFKRIKFFAEFLSARDILDAAAAENYHWRDRIWTPIQTLWAFLVQVLEPDCSCREAVARILAKQAQIRNAGGSLTMRIVYLHAIRDVYRFRVFTSFSSVSVRLWHPFVPQLSHGWPWGFCLWLLRL